MTRNVLSFIKGRCKQPHHVHATTQQPIPQRTSYPSSQLNDVEEETLVDYLRSVEVPLQDMVHRLNDAFRFSCQILIELSSLPTVVSIDGTSSPDQASGRSGTSTGFRSSSDLCRTEDNFDQYVIDFRILEYGECVPTDIPEWLQCLLICACLLSPIYAELQLQSINTLLELIDLLDTGIEQKKQQSKRARKDVRHKGSTVNI